MSYINVAIAAPLHRLFTYKTADNADARPGMRVLVPFRRRQMVGYVISSSELGVRGSENIKIKEILEVLDEEPIFSKNVLELIKWISDYYCAPIGEVCRTALPKGLTTPPKTKRKRIVKDQIIDEAFLSKPVVTLNPAQQNAYKELRSKISDQKFTTTLLHGVTGSGKTEVYLKCFEDLIRDGKQVLFLVPEIGLTPQLVGYVASRFEGMVATYHSGLTDAQRLNTWNKIRSNEVSIVVGTRSAIFAPFSNLGLIVIDEEHDSSYKQEESPRYHGRDVGIMRAKMESVPCILGSATPSLESLNNASLKRYHYIELLDRPAGAELPTVEIVDMCGMPKGSSLSPQSIAAISETLSKNNQAMIFLNRRGYASFVICNSCGHVFKCPNCSISLTYHHHNRTLLCHYCDYKISLPKQCAACHKPELNILGTGTEKLETEIKSLFPNASVARLDRDSVSKSGARGEILSRMKRKKIDILIGTQMITKGHDFPGVTLVLVIDADIALNLPDFRSAERTFQLLTQVSGRAGRSQDKGKVIIQTFSPDHHAVTLAKGHDFSSFSKMELSFRKELSYPPYGKLTLIRFQGMKEKDVQNTADNLIKLLRSTINDQLSTILGPAPAPLSKVRGKYRWQLLIKSNNFSTLRRAVKTAIDKDLPKTPGVQITIDVDPINML